MIVLITFSCKPSSKGDEATAANQLSTDSVAALAGQAYLYGYPLVLLYESMRKATNMEAPVWNSSFAPVNRFAIGDRDKLKYNTDGSLDINIQHDSPGKDKEANWLPAGMDGFTLTMRLYWPKEEFLNGSWKIPAVRKV